MPRQQSLPMPFRRWWPPFWTRLPPTVCTRGWIGFRLRSNSATTKLAADRYPERADSIHRQLATVSCVANAQRRIQHRRDSVTIPRGRPTTGKWHGRRTVHWYWLVESTTSPCAWRDLTPDRFGRREWRLWSLQRVFMTRFMIRTIIHRLHYDSVS